MLNAVLSKVFGSRNERLLKNLRRTVAQVNAQESALRTLTDEALARKTAEFRERAGRGESLDALLAEAFAVVREAARRALDMRHFDVQIIGGMVLHMGKIAEMRTGEGKTLVATLPAYLNAISGRPVHIVTVNDYLARRDADWMGQIYRFLGLEVGVIASGQDPAAKRSAYRADIVYGTNNEYGFDYLRDNMAFTKDDRFQRGLGFAVVDEVDSILIDEARTPLIISGPAEESTELYQRINTIIPRLTRQKDENAPGDFSVDEKSRQVYLSEEGHDHAERLLTETGLLPSDSSLYDVTNITLLHHLYAGLRAHALFQRDVDYIVRDDQVVIIDEFTGRMMTGRRWSDGLHQAVEAKEGVKVQQENQTLASITFQNYFRLYEKLSGMTGTADTEAVEFQQIYNLEVVVIPTHRPMIRDDRPDLVYRTRDEKFRAVLQDVKDCHARRKPVLLGTTSIETSEYLSTLMKKDGVPHEVLNAKHHEREAQIVAQAGRPGAVTIATNMAGRGTDIVLGGNPAADLAQAADDAARAALRAEWQGRHEEVVTAGGLHIIGTERHESRRVDNQLRGRSGRQGDPGSSRFYLSLEDSLMRIFGSERLSGLMQKLGMQEDEAIEHPWVTRAIENAQRKVEGRNFDIRKQLLEYDDIANEQRKIVYRERNGLMDTDDISQNVVAMRKTAIDTVISRSLPPQSLEEQWNLQTLEEDLEQEYGLKIPIRQWLEADQSLHEEPLRERIHGEIAQAYAHKEERIGAPVIRHLEKAVTLQVLDAQWKEHLANMDHLRQGIGLRGYAQKNPKQEYKREAFELFSAMLDRVRYEVVAILSRVQVREESEVEAMEARHRHAGPMEFLHPHAAAEAAPDETAMPAPEAAPSAAPQPVVRTGPKVGRNDPCPCGSGKKYKHCHGKLQ